MSIQAAVSELEARRLARRMPDQDLVNWATELAKGLDNALPRGGDSQVKSQISRAAEAAQQSPAIVLFSAWVRYQYARTQSSKLWTTRTTLWGKETEVAHAILSVVDRIKTEVTNAAREESKTAGRDGTEADQPEQRLIERATMHATARFLGFFRRAVVAETGWKEARS